jgi:hypothetical protein
MDLVKSVLVALLILLITPIFFFDSDKLNIVEIRYYIVVFLLCLIVFCFGVLRLFNAITVNSMFLKNLRKSLTISNTRMAKLGLDLHSLSQKVDHNTKSEDSSTDDLVRTIEKLIAAIKKSDENRK